MGIYEFENLEYDLIKIFHIFSIIDEFGVINNNKFKEIY